MADPTKPPYGDTTPTQQYEHEPVGKLDGHNFTDETGKALSFSDKVPRLRLYEGAPWEHEVSVAWDKGGIGYVIWLIASYVLSCVKPPLFNTTDQENQRAAFQLIKLAGKHFDDSEVQSILRQIFPDTSGLTREWADVEDKTPSEIQNFLTHVEQQYRAIENLAIGEVPFVNEAKKEILDHLNDLKRLGAQKLAGAWHQKYEALKNFPVDKDPVVFFKFYHSLVNQLNKLKTYNASQITSIDNPLEYSINKLEELKNTVEREIPRRLSEVKNEIASKMPTKRLHDLAKNEHIALSKKGSFVEQIQEFQSKISEKKDEAESSRKRLFAESIRLEKELQALNLEKVECQKKDSSLIEKKNKDIEDLNRKTEDQLEIRKSELSQEIGSLQIKIDLVRKENLKWRTEHLPFWSNELSTEDKVIYENMQKNVTEFEKDLRTKIKFGEHILAPSLETDKKIKLAEIEKQFNLSSEVNQATFQRVEADLKKNEAARGEANMWTKNEGEVRRLEKVENDFNKAWDEQLESNGVKDNSKLLARLTFLEGAFKDYQNHLKEDPIGWLKKYYAEPQDSFKQNLLSSLESLGVHAGSNVYQTTEETISQVLLPNLDGTPLDRKGLEEFQ